MPNAKTLLLGLLALLTAWYILAWFRTVRGTRGGPPSALELVVGAVTNFFDTLGIGSYAPTTAIYKFKRMVPDEHIPGTMTIGHTLPAITEAFIFITIVEVEFKTLVGLITVSVLGARLGAGVVARWPRRKIQFGMGFALLAAAALFVIKNLDEMRGVPTFPGGEAIGLDGTLLVIGLVGNFVVGALMTIGVGLYAPCLIMISLLGMNPRTAFPIMMGSCAFLMPVAGAKFLKEGSFNARAALGLTLAGIPAVLVGALIIKSLPLTTLRWLVVVVVLYSALMMIRSGVVEARSVAK